MFVDWKKIEEIEDILKKRETLSKLTSSMSSYIGTPISNIDSVKTKLDDMIKMCDIEILRRVEAAYLNGLDYAAKEAKVEDSETNE